ncbi:hypothetical protein D3C84_547930 [compost metagenome]
MPDQRGDAQHHLAENPPATGVAIGRKGADHPDEKAQQQHAIQPVQNQTSMERGQSGFAPVETQMVTQAFAGIIQSLKQDECGHDDQCPEHRDHEYQHGEHRRQGRDNGGRRDA